MRKIGLAVLLIVLGTVLFVGCGDEENTIVSGNSDILARGYVSLNPQLFSNVYFYGVTTALIEVDSVIVADSLMYMSGSVLNVNTSRASLTASYYNSEDSTRFVSGDVIDVAMFTPSGISNASVSALEYAVDSVSVIESSVPISIPRYGSFTFHWHPSENADWYLIDFANRGPSGVYSSEYTQDTFFMIDSQYTNSGYVEFNISPVSGPLPTDNIGNITGGNIRGAIYGTTWGSYVGVDVIYTAGIYPKLSPIAEPRDPFEALDELLDRYQK